MVFYTLNNIRIGKNPVLEVNGRIRVVKILMTIAIWIDVRKIIRIRIGKEKDKEANVKA